MTENEEKLSLANRYKEAEIAKLRNQILEFEEEKLRFLEESSKLEKLFDNEELLKVEVTTSLTFCSPGSDTRVCPLRSDNHEVTNNGAISICSKTL